MFTRSRARVSDSVSVALSQAAIDLDLQLMENLLHGATADDFVAAAAVYVEGAFSWPYAQLKIDEGLPVKLTPGISIQSVNQHGATVHGTVLEGAPAGSKTLKVQYTPSSVQAEYVTCQVGANPHPNFDGCKLSCIMNVDVVEMCIGLRLSQSFRFYDRLSTSW